MASNELFLKKKAPPDQTWGTKILSGYERNPTKKDTRWSFKSLIKGLYDAATGIALSTPTMQFLGHQQTKAQLEKGIKPTVENNLLLKNENHQKDGMVICFYINRNNIIGDFV